MKTIQWRGVFPAMTTKLNADLSLDLPAIRAGVQRLILDGVAGVVMMGMVGENAQLAPDEKFAVLRAAVEAAADRVPVISGLADTSTQRAAAYAAEAQKLGIAGFMVFPALTYKSDARETVEFYRSVARATELPLMVYNNPRGYGVDLIPDVVEQLLVEPNIVALKEESYDVTRVTDLITRFGASLNVLCGVDDLILESSVLGVTCWVSGMANAVPKASVKLLELANAGEYTRARELYRVLTPLFHLDTEVKLVQHIKLAENMITGSSEVMKPPRLPLVGKEREKTMEITRKTLEGLKSLGY